MKKIALSLIALCILFGQNVSAQTADQRPQTIKPAYEIIAVPDQDLNNTNKPILYRYKITAPKSGPLTISGETIEIQAVGVVPETINLKVFSDKDFKKEIDKKSLKFNVNLGKQKLNFAFKDPIKVKAGDTVYVQIDTAIKGNKDTAYITTKPLGLSEVTVKAKPIKIPSIIITDPAGNQGIHVNVGDTFTLSGTPKNLNGLKYWTGDGFPPRGYYNRAWFFDSMFVCSDANEASTKDVWAMTCKAKKTGVGKIYVEIYSNGSVYPSKSNSVEITAGPSYPQGTVKVITPNGGESFAPGSNVTIKVETNLTEKQAEGINLQLYKYIEGKEFPYSYVQTIESLWIKGFPYEWKVPTIEPGQYVIYASVLPTFPSKDIMDFSDKPFTITNSSGGSCSFTRDLTIGSTGQDVVNLQVFLENKGFLAAPDGTSYNGNPPSRGYFGALTQAALAKYQNSIGISPADGYFGPVTRTKLTEDCSMGVSVLWFNGQNSSVTGGKKGTYSMTMGDSNFRIYSGYDNAPYYGRGEALRVSVESNNNRSDYWDITIGTLPTIPRSIFQVGTYEGATRSGGTSTSTATAYLDFSGSGRGANETVGWFKILEIERDSEGKVIKLAFDFEQQTSSGGQVIENSKVSGSVRYNSTIPTNKVFSRAEKSNLSSNDSSFLSVIDLEVGATHEFVKTIQKYLNSNGYIVNENLGEPGSIGYESDYFGKKTQQALIKFQKDKGITPAQGYFGPKTRAVMGI